MVSRPSGRDRLLLAALLRGGLLFRSGLLGCVLHRVILPNRILRLKNRSVIHI